MRGRFYFGVSVLLAFAVAVALPWLAFQEARRQAYDATAEMTLRYARDILHRSDETARQAQDAIERLARENAAPCSESSLALMRYLDLSSTYIQAVGAIRDGAVLCSSLGAWRIELGRPSFRTATGVTFYLNIPPIAPGALPLMALERDHFVVLVHRNLPLDTSVGIAGVSLGILHQDSPNAAPELGKGHVDRAWLAALGSRTEGTFIAGQYLVAAVRSRQFRIAAVAAVPVAQWHARTRAIAQRLVPGGALAGLAIAVAIVLLARQQRSLPTALRYALRRDEFFLEYQPIVALATGRIVGVEALLRWRRSTGELIGPDLFIPVAERSGIVTRLTERVFALAEADAGAFLAGRPDFHIAFNLAAEDLLSPAIVTVVDRFLERSGAAPSSVIVEITERGFLDMDSALPVIAALRARGIEVAIDDFGTGYSSLSYLETLELDYLKIDRSFIVALGTRAPTSQVVGHIIAMAKTMKLCMIAEGVESRAQAEFLIANDVEFAQGWLFGRPVSFAEVRRLAAEAPPA